MRIVNLGNTRLPMDVIHDYLESLRPIYSLEVSFVYPLLFNPPRVSKLRQIGADVGAGIRSLAA